ncbi:MAG: cation:proton antiporter [Flavobacteriales bacterium]|nr:cation:proton antiporter [Flavobacteriales bacterium]HQV76441.1 cation:proton antiporter [Flavobacteriales bacterium]HQW42087.1 cation:proton antiporter [Flavobacteriales bacterium]
MADYLIVFVGLGLAILLMAALPTISKAIKISYPIFLIGIGMVLYAIGLPILWPDPYWPDAWLMHISELIVIVSLMGAGLKIGKHYEWKRWRMPLRLVLLTMPLSLVVIYFIGAEFLMLSVPASMLLAAALAPTDPVLAAEVQLEDLGKEEGPDDVSFTLTAEAGLNDGLAFPFTILAVVLASSGGWGDADIVHWLWDTLLLKVLLGVVLGLASGYAVRGLVKLISRRSGESKVFGFIALATTFLTYGLTEICHGYGFLAVFFAGLSLRHKDHGENESISALFSFTDEVENLLIVVWLILFGGSIFSGLLSSTDWKGMVAALGIVLFVRPLIAFVSTLGSSMPLRSRLGVSFFGIKGIGTFFYLSWAFLEFEFENKYELYAIAAYVVLFSVVIHGVTAPRAKARMG